MFEFEVIGFRRYSGEYEGRAYGGYFVHVAGISTRDGFFGREVQEIKVKDRFGYKPAVGEIIAVTYDRNGICDVQKVG